MEKSNQRMMLGLVACVLFSILASFLAAAASGQRSKEKDPDSDSQWEYLVVAGGNSNLSTSGNEQYPNLRKQPDGSFGREFFPLERNMDKLGAKGWELTAIHGPANEPVYFFKRHKPER